MSKKTLIPIAAFLLSFLTLNQAKAICPVCTITVGAGVGLCRWLGIDDVLSGIWMGGLIVSVTGWTLSWLEKKQLRFWGRGPLVPLVFYATIILPLYWAGIIGHALNTFWGIDKLVLGIIFGSLAFMVALAVNSFLKRMNHGKAFFPFQKVVLPIVFLIITTLIFHKIIGCKLF